MGRMKKKEKKKREEGGRRGYLYPGGQERVWRGSGGSGSTLVPGVSSRGPPIFQLPLFNYLPRKFSPLFMDIEAVV